MTPSVLVTHDVDGSTDVTVLAPGPARRCMHFGPGHETDARCAVARLIDLGAQVTELDGAPIHADRRDTVAAVDQIVALYPDPETRPPAVAVVYTQLAGGRRRQED